MSRIVVFNSVTLDGVMQAPGGNQEDPRGGFTQGGWAVPYSDEVMLRAAGKGMAQSGGLLLGRFTYEAFHGYWPHQTDNPFTDHLNATRKYVVSTTLEEPLPWENSTLLRGPEAVAELRDEHITVLGSGELIAALLPLGLIDAFVLLIHPLVLGAGRRLFREGAPPASFRLVASQATTTGVLMATYEAG